MRLVLIAALLAVPTAALADTRTWTPARFDRIESKGAWDVTVVTGPRISVVAEGRPRDLSRLVVEVRDGVLEIRPERGWDMVWRQGERVSVRVVAPPLRGASLAGSGDLRLDRVSTPRFAGDVAGSGNLDIGQVDSREVALSVAGSGDILARGRADRVSADVAGSGNIMAGNLRARVVSADTAGSGDIQAFATGRASVSIAGSGDVMVRGGARCAISRVGSGRADCRG